MTNNKSTKTNWRRRLLCALSLLVVASSTGCQITSGGMTLPSPWYVQDDIQYYPPGPEFVLSKEAAAMKQYKDDQALLGN